MLRDLARLRLAYVLIEEQAFDEATKLLDGKTDPSLEARFLEARGDILLMSEKRAEARTAYQSALARFDENVRAGGAAAAAMPQSYRSVIEVKLDAVGGPQ